MSASDKCSDWEVLMCHLFLAPSGLRLTVVFTPARMKKTREEQTDWDLSFRSLWCVSLTVCSDCVMVLSKRSSAFLPPFTLPNRTRTSAPIGQSGGRGKTGGGAEAIKGGAEDRRGWRWRRRGGVEVMHEEWGSKKIWQHPPNCQETEEGERRSVCYHQRGGTATQQS